MKTSLKRSPAKGSPLLRRDPLLPVLGVAVVVLAVVALWLFFSGQPPGNDSVEAGFARDMIVHHAQAVEMAEIVRDKTEDEDMRVLTSDLALTQQGQIGQMEGWLSVWGLPATGTEPAMTWMGHPTEGRMPGMASPEELEELREASPEEADILMLQLMIPHHQAAIPMAEAALEETSNPAVERLASAIVASQSSEIEVMQDLLAERGVESESPAEDDPASDHDHGGAHDHG